MKTLDVLPIFYTSARSRFLGLLRLGGDYMNKIWIGVIRFHLSVTNLTGSQPELPIPTKLSPGLPEKDYMVQVIIYVTDSLGCFTTVNLTVTVSNKSWTLLSGQRGLIKDHLMLCLYYRLLCYFCYLHRCY